MTEVGRLKVALEEVYSFAEVSFLSLPLQAGEGNHFKILKMKLFILSIFIANCGSLQDTV